MLAPDFDYDDETLVDEEAGRAPSGDPVRDTSARVLGTVCAYTKLLANEPTVGMYYVQEHVHKSVPFVLATRTRIKEAQKTAQLCQLDVDSCLSTLQLVREVGGPTLQSCEDSVRRAARAVETMSRAQGAETASRRTR